jgi:hypothetical protein
MEFVYVKVYGGAIWEDITILVNKENAIIESLKHPTCRIEIFVKKTEQDNYIPTYNYYKNGELFISQ